MIIGLLGDIHGRVRLALSALTTWQRLTGLQFDLLLQVGDLGAFPSLETMDGPTRDYLSLDPAEGDFYRMLNASGADSDWFQVQQAQLSSPIYFIRGNHQDMVWLSSLPREPRSGIARVDPYGLFMFVPDGLVIPFSGFRIAFLGGLAAGHAKDNGIDTIALESLATLPAGVMDLLLTHDCPYGVSRGYSGQAQGSVEIADLVDSLKPRFHVAGHLHTSIRLQRNEREFICLNNIVGSSRWHPETKGVRSGWLAILDTRSGSLAPVDDPAQLAAMSIP